MATYAIGDVQGCYDELAALVKKVKFKPGRDEFIFCGDVVNRGPKSLKTLRWLYEHRDSCRAVLGNHDLHLIATYFGHRTYKKRDTIQQIIKAPDAEKLVSFVATWPFTTEYEDNIMLHAGVNPQWSLRDLRHRSAQLRARLAADPESFARGDISATQRETLTWLTAVRCVDKRGNPIVDFKWAPEHAPSSLTPWFACKRKPLGKRVIFGHWAMLDHRVNKRWISLDSACVWGGELTAWSFDDERAIQVTA